MPAPPRASGPDLRLPYNNLPKSATWEGAHEADWGCLGGDTRRRAPTAVLPTPHAAATPAKPGQGLSRGRAGAPRDCEARDSADGERGVVIADASIRQTQRVAAVGDASLIAACGPGELAGTAAAALAGNGEGRIGEDRS